MSTPDWADPDLSSELASLCGRGESQEREFMREYPQKARDLAKEIAAFATSNGGTIVLGVADDGVIVGLQDAETAGDRDRLVRRVEGICRGTVRPAVTPTVSFAVHGDSVVMVVRVPNGSEPIYYVSNVPYMRHLTESRPAEPGEVLDLVRRWLDEGTNAPSPASEFFSSLARVVVTLLTYGDQASERQVNPWLDEWRSIFDESAAELRVLAASSIAVERGMAEELQRLADAVDYVANLRLHMGCAPQLDAALANALTLTRQFKSDHIDPIPLSQESVSEVRSAIVECSRLLDALMSRADYLAQGGRVSELQDEASRIGERLVQLSYHNLDGIRTGLADELRQIATCLHLTETMRLYADGGRSLQAILDRIRESNSQLATVLS